MQLVCSTIQGVHNTVCVPDESFVCVCVLKLRSSERVFLKQLLIRGSRLIFWCLLYAWMRVSYVCSTLYVGGPRDLAKSVAQDTSAF